MPRQQNKPPRQIVVKVRKPSSGTRYDAYQQLAVLLAAAGLENTPVYLKEDKSGAGVQVRLYCPDDPCEAWLDLWEDLDQQVQALVYEVWGKDTYKQASATLALGAGETLREAAEPVPPTRNGGKANSRA